MGVTMGVTMKATPGSILARETHLHRQSERGWAQVLSPSDHINTFLLFSYDYLYELQSMNTSHDPFSTYLTNVQSALGKLLYFWLDYILKTLTHILMKEYWFNISKPEILRFSIIVLCFMLPTYHFLC